MTPAELLLGARHLLTGSDGALYMNATHRAAVLLARQALEASIRAKLEPYGLDADVASFTAQLLCLQGTTREEGKAREVAALWSALSLLTHHHGYELPPTRSELETLLARTARVLAYLGNERMAGDAIE